MHLMLQTRQETGRPLAGLMDFESLISAAERTKVAACGLDLPCTMAEVFQPQDGQKVEFWTGRMSLDGSGIAGWFERGRFWSHEKADHWSCSEIVRWQAWQEKVADPLESLLSPSEGQKVEFWSRGMSREGSGIAGVFKRGLFWSSDLADHWGPGEVAYWSALEGC